ncbi:MAG: hypothetical protein M0D57_10510 [Sphingobacteriales bacterium JAD_PAG50586_3]|nr:MAG: hypothetical protein M0D57_10510 [Sphingobacteriales bacterium JAD_PAG50586_3]
MTPNNRRAFERHIDLLIESVNNNKFKIPRDARMIQSLVNIKKLPNGRANFVTVDESARLLANMSANFANPNFKIRNDAE